ncbi:RDD family protein [Streptomyces sp. CB01881]|nr:RDD family protein [Streptomyces sp. CB01881]
MRPATTGVQGRTRASMVLCRTRTGITDLARPGPSFGRRHVEPTPVSDREFVMSVPADSVQTPPVRPCPNCGRDWGQGLACQFCRQVAGLPQGVPLATPALRFGEYLLEGVLIVVTLVIGWLIWSLFAFANGQTPAKQVLGMRCVKLRTEQTATWGTMFLREAIAKPVIGLLAWVTFGIVYFWLLWDRNTQQLWDKMVDTIVVKDPQDAMRPAEQKSDAEDWASTAGSPAGE